jgi:3-hydroxyacyl-CoA dehydrogenase
MTLAMVNEAAHCLAEGVVADAGMLDLALVYGAGFPPFRGGPLRHADSLGLARVEARLTALRAEKGERFKPAPLIVSSRPRADLRRAPSRLVSRRRQAVPPSQRSTRATPAGRMAGAGDASGGARAVPPSRRPARATLRPVSGRPGPR